MFRKFNSFYIKNLDLCSKNGTYKNVKIVSFLYTGTRDREPTLERNHMHMIYVERS